MTSQYGWAAGVLGGCLTTLLAAAAFHFRAQLDMTDYWASALLVGALVLLGGLTFVELPNDEITPATSSESDEDAKWAQLLQRRA